MYNFYTQVGSQLHDQAVHCHTNSSKATGKVHTNYHQRNARPTNLPVDFWSHLCVQATL